MTVQDRARGALIGLAVGDAIGATVEFVDRGKFAPLTDMVGGGVYRLLAGQWTDDTSMAICLADSIIANDSINPNDLLERFLRWYRYGENSSTGCCFDIGTTTKVALHQFEKMKTYQPLPDDYFSSGNGSIMRLAPVAIRWHDDAKLAAEYAVVQSLTTHGSQICSACCIELAQLLVSAINGDDVMPGLELYAQLVDLEGTIPNSGFGPDTLKTAKWAVGKTKSFDDAVLLAANQGGDADTIAAVAGQIAGAIYGFGSIRKSWREKLYRFVDLLELAEELLN
jgi:ADP-ribosyl-[dinitrogen reductase] hydrolase